MNGRRDVETKRGDLLQEEVHKDLDDMRQYIIETVWKLQDEKLLKTLFTRAKNINKM